MAAHLDLEEQEQLEQLKAFWKRWGNLITWVITAALAAFAGWQYWNHYQAQEAADAGARYDEMQAAVVAQNLDKAASVTGDLRAKFAGTGYAAQASLLLAKMQADKGKIDEAKDSLGWVAANAAEPAYKDIARLRLAGLLLDAKAYDQASQALDGIKSADFAALVADRRGDILMLQDKRDAAKAEYQKALAGLEKTQENQIYRTIVEAKLATLGVPVTVEATGAAQ